MAKFKTIFENKSLFGGYAFRVTSDGETVNLQSRAPGNKSFKTEVTMPRSEFDSFADEKGLYDPANDDPGTLSRLITDRQLEF